jgi:hypothetical protein
MRGAQLVSQREKFILHALIHNQLQAPIYRNMMSYAWYAAKLVTPQSYLQCKSSSIPSRSKKVQNMYSSRK